MIQEIEQIVIKLRNLESSLSYMLNECNAVKNLHIQDLETINKLNLLIKELNEKLNKND